MAKSKQSAKNSKSSSSTTPSAPAPAPAPAPTNENVVVSAEPDTVLAAEFTEFAALLQQVSMNLNALKSKFKQLEKNSNRIVRNAQKHSKKKKAKGTRKPSGFVKPTRISKELATFLGREHGSEMARTEVTREINKYIREHKLQDKDNGRKINPDKQLAKLLKIQKKDELTYFNLQKYMSPHFQKAGQELGSDF